MCCSKVTVWAFLDESVGGVLQNVVKCCRVLQSLIECLRVLQGFVTRFRMFRVSFKMHQCEKCYTNLFSKRKVRSHPLSSFLSHAARPLPDLSHANTLSPPLSHTKPPTLTRTLPISPALALSLTHSLSHTHILSLFISHSHSLSLSLSTCVYPQDCEAESGASCGVEGAAPCVCMDPDSFCE